jgi:hypothetical protein
MKRWFGSGWRRVRLGKGFWVGVEVIWLRVRAGAAWKGVLDRWLGVLAQSESGRDLGRGFGFVMRWFGSGWRRVGLGKRFWVGEEVILFRMKASEAWEGVLSIWGGDLAPGGMFTIEKKLCQNSFKMQTVLIQFHSMFFALIDWLIVNFGPSIYSLAFAIKCIFLIFSKIFCLNFSEVFHRA